MHQNRQMNRNPASFYLWKMILDIELVREASLVCEERASSSSSTILVSGYKVSLPMLIFVSGNEINDVVAAN